MSTCCVSPTLNLSFLTQDYHWGQLVQVVGANVRVDFNVTTREAQASSAVSFIILCRYHLSMTISFSPDVEILSHDSSSYIRTWKHMENTESDQSIQVAEACTLCKNISLHDTCFCTFLNPPRLYSALWSGVRDGQEVRGERDREREHC